MVNFDESTSLLRPMWIEYKNNGNSYASTDKQLNFVAILNNILLSLMICVSYFSLLLK